MMDTQVGGFALKMNKQFSHFAVQFPVSDIDHAIKWYTEKLGFSCTFKWGDPVDYAVLKRDEAVSIHLTNEGENKAIEHRTIYIFCFDVDSFHLELKERELKELNDPITHEYGMRDFTVIDPFGHRIVFGTGQ